MQAAVFFGRGGAHTLHVSGALCLVRSGMPVPQIQTFPGGSFPIVMRCTREAHIEGIGALMRPLASVCEPQVVEAISWADEGEKLPHHKPGDAVDHLKVQIAGAYRDPRVAAHREER